jgi:hypothetical protein
VLVEEVELQDIMEVLVEEQQEMLEEQLQNKRTDMRVTQVVVETKNKVDKAVLLLMLVNLVIYFQEVQDTTEDQAALDIMAVEVLVILLQDLTLVVVVDHLILGIHK